MTKRKKINPPVRHQTGAALIEALVAILILSIGVLGMVGMQSASIRYEQNSWARAAVSSLVGDISDRIRANPGSANDAYVYSATYANERDAINTNSSYFSVGTECLTTTCTPAQLATYDVARWRENLNKLVPGSVGIVTGTRDSAYNVTVAWFDKSWVSGAGALETATTCTAALVQAAARNCCPAALGTVAGMRCVNFAVVP
jgi:type IV pilus assembly protein PilV